jgi:hypothetical protein
MVFSNIRTQSSTESLGSHRQGQAVCAPWFWLLQWTLTVLFDFCGFYVFTLEGKLNNFRFIFCRRKEKDIRLKFLTGKLTDQHGKSHSRVISKYRVPLNSFENASSVKKTSFAPLWLYISLLLRVIKWIN